MGVDLSIWADKGIQAANTVQTITVVLLIIGMFLGIGIYLFYLLQNKHKVRIRDIANGKIIIKDVRAREYTDDKGVTWWKMTNIKNPLERYLPIPDPKAIDIDERGKKVVEVYRLPTGEYCSIYDKANISLIPPDVYDNISAELKKEKEDILKKYSRGLEQDKAILKWKSKVVDKWIKDNGYDNAFHPFTTQDRQAIVNNLKDAAERRNKNLWKDLPQIASIAGMVIIVISILVFAPDWFTGKQELARINQGTAETQRESLQLLRDIKYEIQTIESQQDDISTRLTNLENEPPN